MPKSIQPCSLSTPLTILVAGAAGFVGTNFLRRVANYPEVTVIAVYHERMPIVKGSNIQYVQSDLRNLNHCHQLMDQVDQVFMFAGRLSTTAVLKENPLGPVTENTVINLNMLEAAFLSKVKSYVWLSSSTGYPQRDSPLREYEFFEEHPPSPYESVGWMSRYIEIIADLYARRSKGRLAVSSLRPSGMYGPHDDFEFETCHALPAIMRRVLECRDSIEIWGSGKDERDYIFVDDVVDACLMAAQTVTGSISLNIGSGKTHSLNELLELMLRWESQEHVSLNHRGDVGLPVMRRTMDCGKAQKELNFAAKTDIQQGLQATMKWWRDVMSSESQSQVIRA